MAGASTGHAPLLGPDAPGSPPAGMLFESGGLTARPPDAAASTSSGHDRSASMMGSTAAASAAAAPDGSAYARLSATDGDRLVAGSAAMAASGRAPGNARGVDGAGALPVGGAGREAAAGGDASGIVLPAGASAAKRMRAVAFAALGRLAAAHRALAWLPLWFAFLSSTSSVADPQNGAGGGGGGDDGSNEGWSQAAAAIPSVPAIAYVVVKVVFVLDCLVRCVALVRYGIRWRVVWAVPSPARRLEPSPQQQVDEANGAAGRHSHRPGAEAGLAVQGAVAAGEAADEEDDCPICQDTMADAVALVPCGHRFCRSCATTWVEGHQSTCPVCRQAVAQDAHPPCMDGGDGAVSLWPMLM